VRITDVIPRGRYYASDFKCSAPGEDEQDLFECLARLARIDARVVDRWATGTITLVIQIGGRDETIEFARQKYLVPPTAMMELLDRELERAGREHRLVACRDDLTEAVVLATPSEIAELGGLVINTAT
jgi:hypothetical protein